MVCPFISHVHNVQCTAEHHLYRTLVNRIANYAHRLGSSSKFVENCTKLTTLKLLVIGSSAAQCHGVKNFKSDVIETFRCRDML